VYVNKLENQSICGCQSFLGLMNSGTEQFADWLLCRRQFQKIEQVFNCSFAE